MKAHIGVVGNECANELAKLGYMRVDAPLVTEGRVRALSKGVRAVERLVVGCGMGRAAQWGRGAASHYAQLWTNKGDLGVWRERLARGSGLCCLCVSTTESGPHLVFDCWKGVPRRGWCWGGWGELDDRALWRYQYKEGAVLGTATGWRISLADCIGSCATSGERGVSRSLVGSFGSLVV